MKLHKTGVHQCMGRVFRMEFQRVPLKFHTKYPITMTPHERHVVSNHRSFNCSFNKGFLCVVGFDTWVKMILTNQFLHRKCYCPMSVRGLYIHLCNYLSSLRIFSFCKLNSIKHKEVLVVNVYSLSILRQHEVFYLTSSRIWMERAEDNISWNQNVYVYVLCICM